MLAKIDSDTFTFINSYMNIWTEISKKEGLAFQLPTTESLRKLSKLSSEQRESGHVHGLVEI